MLHLASYVVSFNCQIDVRCDKRVVERCLHTWRSISSTSIGIVDVEFVPSYEKACDPVIIDTSEMTDGIHQ